ncbi:cytochrome P450 711A1-like [Zingiber officinale]|uniref:Uncharacterized protein n=1 Tax=Zingiber officinale TaxID=94328 RepID=A0A8J5KJ75_ZINOF|nr:cytochrome P450 711A1-like [Zingiber officinale]KAG6491671.1 hypothetical protein ZIOFF_046607 [Zingiber officinale]
MEFGFGWPAADYIFTAAALSVGFLLYFYAPCWAVRKVPGPPALPLVGHLPLLGKHGPEVFGVLAKTYGPIFRFHLGRQPIVIVADADLCKEIGIKRFKSLPNRALPSAVTGSPLHSKGLFNTKDSRWSGMRNTIISMYQPAHLASLIPSMLSYINTATEQIAATPPHEDVAFSKISLQLSTDIIGDAAFGVNFGLSKGTAPDGDDEVSEFVKEHLYSTTSIKMDLSGSLSIILGLICPVLQEPFRQVLKRIPGTADWKIERTNLNLSSKLNKIVAGREKAKRRGANDFLSLILNARDAGGASEELFTADYISALAYEHLLAGSATTSFTLSSVIYLVTQHPEVEEKLIGEIDRFGPFDLVPTAEDLQHKFPYLDQVIKESMRFYTVSPLIGRHASQDVEIGGYFLPKGTWVWLAPGVLEKDPKYFPEPHLFRPERFDLAGDEEKQRHPYAHIPFGIGPRACIAQKFAVQEIKLAVIYLYRHFIFRHSPKMESPLEFQYGIVVNFKHGVKLRAVKRSRA